jgi:AbrB family looped-hinge helix DNA binding protein
MKTSIDRAGRLVIPRSMRSQIGLLEGGEVDLELDGAGIRLEPRTGIDLLTDGEFLVVPKTGMTMDDAAVRVLRDSGQR